MELTGWPGSLAEYLRHTYGAPVEGERLGGLSTARVYRVRGARGSAVVKENASAREASFYERVAPALRRAGLTPPRLELAVREHGVVWLVLEDVPRPLPRSRWGADHAIVALLARLHTIAPSMVSELPDPFRPAWTSGLTAAMRRRFPAVVAAALAAPLRRLEQAGQPLFRPRCAIAGDPNPTNWGVRDDGTPVLFDWERFGWGTPALDLAIALPGLGDRAAFGRMAAEYVRQRRRLGAPLPQAEGRLDREIALAKVWSVVEFLGGPGPAAGERGDEVTRYLMTAVPAWVERVASET